MSSYHPGRDRMDNQSFFENEEQQSEHEFISICQRYNEKTVRQIEVHKRMDMIYNYMIKNDVKIQKKSDIKEEKVRKTRKDKEGRKFICGCQGRPGYLSYPALYTHIKTKHNGITPEGTIRGQSGKPKKRGRPKVRKAVQIYQRQIEKNEFPKELSGLVSRQQLQILDQFDEIEAAEDQQPEISLKYFVNIVRELKKVQNTRIYLLPIAQVITVFLQNIKDYLAESVLQDFEETFFDLITYANKKYSLILSDYQLVVEDYYVDYDLNEGDVYCQHQRAKYLPVIIQRFLRSQLSVEDELQQGFLMDFSRWLVAQGLSDIRLCKDVGNTYMKE